MVPEYPTPIPDGDRVRPPVPRRQLVPGLVAVGVVLVLMVGGIAGWIAL